MRLATVVEPLGVFVAAECDLKTTDCTALSPAAATVVRAGEDRFTVCRSCLERLVAEGEWEIPHATFRPRTAVFLSDPAGRPVMAVGVRDGPRTSAVRAEDWAASIVRNLAAHAALPAARYLILLMLPDLGSLRLIARRLGTTRRRTPSPSSSWLRRMSRFLIATAPTRGNGRRAVGRTPRPEHQAERTSVDGRAGWRARSRRSGSRSCPTSRRGGRKRAGVASPSPVARKLKRFFNFPGARRSPPPSHPLGMSTFRDESTKPGREAGAKPDRLITEEDRDEFAAELERIIDEDGLSQKALAILSGMPATDLSRFVRSRNYVWPETIRRLFKGFQHIESAKALREAYDRIYLHIPSKAPADPAASLARAGKLEARGRQRKALEMVEAALAHGPGAHWGDAVESAARIELRQLKVGSAARRVHRATARTRQQKDSYDHVRLIHASGLVLRHRRGQEREAVGAFATAAKWAEEVGKGDPRFEARARDARCDRAVAIAAASWTDRELVASLEAALRDVREIFEMAKGSRAKAEALHACAVVETAAGMSFRGTRRTLEEGDAFALGETDLEIKLGLALGNLLLLNGSESEAASAFDRVGIQAHRFGDLYSHALAEEQFAALEVFD